MNPPPCMNRQAACAGVAKHHGGWPEMAQKEEPDFGRKSDNPGILEEAGHNSRLDNGGAAAPCQSTLHRRQAMRCDVCILAEKPATRWNCSRMASVPSPPQSGCGHGPISTAHPSARCPPESRGHGHTGCNHPFCARLCGNLSCIGRDMEHNTDICIRAR